VAAADTLIVRLSSMGDLFHALPAVHGLKAARGGAIDWVTQGEYAALVRCCADVRHVIPFARRSTPGTLLALWRAVREREYAMVVDFQGLLKSALIARLARARVRLGPSYHREGAALFYTAVAGPRNKRRHAVDENLDVIRHLGLTAPAPEFPLRFPAVPLDAPRPRVGLVPVSRWATKNWPPESFAAAAARLQREAGAAIVLFGSAADAPVCAAIAAGLDRSALNLAGRTSLVEMGGYLQQMDAVIANDTGPLHMAAACGVPVIGIYGATDPVRTGPFGPRHRVLTADEPCRPCLARTCRFGTRACLARVTPDRVVEAALTVLREAP
jgi:lipopolysaccharide heptosyltransferase I